MLVTGHWANRKPVSQSIQKISSDSFRIVGMNILEMPFLSKIQQQSKAFFSELEVLRILLGILAMELKRILSRSCIGLDPFIKVLRNRALAKQASKFLQNGIFVQIDFPFGPHCEVGFGSDRF